MPCHRGLGTRVSKERGTDERQERSVQFWSEDSRAVEVAREVTAKESAVGE